MRILYDGDIYGFQPAGGGINRYFGSLIGRLPADFDLTLTVRSPLEGDYPSHPNLKIVEYDRLRLMPLSYRLSLYRSRLRNQALRIVLANKRFDVLHPTYYSLLTRQSLGSYRSPVVITVWDMIDELFPSTQDPTGDHAEAKRKAIHAAQKIICISENTKKDLLERYSIPESKVVVTYLAAELDERLSFGSERVPSRPYYIYVGSRALYKNFGGLLKAFAKAISKRRDLTLCVVGGAFSKAEQELIAELKLSEHVEQYGNTTDSHLAKLYRCSIALVYPSLYEGFGLPPLEAMACGTPVIAANTSSIPEVVGNAAILFDPFAIDDLASILLFLADDQTERHRLVERGHQRVKQFSWEGTTARTIAVYRSVSE